MKTKKTEGKILEGWRMSKLGELFDFKNGVNADKAQYGSGSRFINVMEVINHDALTEEMIPGRVDLDVKSLEKNAVEYGDVLFNRTSETPEEIGLTSVYLGKEKVVFGGFVIRARAKTKDLLVPFRKYCFSAKLIRTEIIKRGQGAVRSNIGQEDLSDISIRFPSLPEQCRIVAVLETWDQVIEKLKRKIEIKKEIRREFMRELLANEAKHAKDNWTTTSVGDLGKLVSGGTPSKQIEKYWNGEIPWISSSDLHENDINFVNIHRYITSDAVENSTTNIIPKDSVITVSRVGVGKVIVSREPLCTSQDFQSLVVDKSKADSRFIAHLLMIELQKLLIRNQGTSIKGFLKKDLEDLTIVMPSIVEQKKIADILDDLDQYVELLERKLVILTAQKTYLLNNLVTGTIRTPETLSVNV